MAGTCVPVLKALNIRANKPSPEKMIVTGLPKIIAP
jgi:hypothetical protein